MRMYIYIYICIYSHTHTHGEVAKDHPIGFNCQLVSINLSRVVYLSESVVEPSACQVFGLAWWPFPSAGTSLSVRSDILTAYRPALLTEESVWVPLPPALETS